MIRRTSMSMAVSAAALLFASGAQASLELISPVDLQGAGLGTVNTILTITSPGSSTFESGSVGLDGTGTQVVLGDAQTGASQTQVRSLSTLGIGTAAELRVVFN